MLNFLLNNKKNKVNCIFCDGIFSIQPTANNFKIENGILVSGTRLVIPYVSDTDDVYIDLIPTGGYGDCSISCLREVAHNDCMGKDGLNIRHIYYTDDFTVRLNSKNLISINLETTNLKIKNIYTINKKVRLGMCRERERERERANAQFVCYIKKVGAKIMALNFLKINKKEKKNYILKDGLFNIQPTTNTLRKSENNWQFSNENSRLTIPYISIDEDILIEFESRSGWSGYYYFGNGKDRTMIYMCNTTGTFVFRFPAGTSIDLRCTNAPGGGLIKSIWIEKVKEIL